MKQKLVTIVIILSVILSCSQVDPQAEKERAHFFHETMLGFEYIVNGHYTRYQETYGTFYSGSNDEHQKHLKNIFDANFELKGIIDYRMVEDNSSEEDKRQLLFEELNKFVKNTVSNVPEYYSKDFQKYIGNMQFNKIGFNEIHVLDSTDRHMFMTKAHMITTRAIQMNY